MEVVVESRLPSTGSGTSTVPTPTTEGTPSQRPKRSNERGPRLSRTERKRFSYLVAHDHTKAEAADLAKLTIAEREGSHAHGRVPASKRLRSAGSTPSPQQAALTKNPMVHPVTPDAAEAPSEEGTGATKPSYSVAVSGVKIGIISADSPRVTLTVEQLTDLENRLIELVLKSRLKSLKTCPRFKGTSYRPGYMVLICEDIVAN